MAGVQPHTVQQRLGHSSLSMTMSVYAHILPEMQQDAAARLAEVIQQLLSNLRRKNLVSIRRV